MTLYDILPKDGAETTVFDSVYDMETYFYFSDNDDGWDKAMMDLSRLLDVVETKNGGITVNLSDVIEKHIEHLDGLFISCNLDDIMADMDNILAGNVSEEWLNEFVSILKED